MAEMMSSSCLKLIAKIDERDQDAILARLDELQAQGVPAKRAQVQAAIDVLKGLRSEAGGSITRSPARGDDILSRANGLLARLGRPSSDAAWTEQRVQDLLDEFAYTNDDTRSKAYAGFVRPEDFLRATTPSEGVSKLESENRPLDREQLANNRQPIMLIGEPDGNKWKTTGHEGRHRMMALRDAGVDRVPVVFRVGYGLPRKVIDDVYVQPQRWSGGPTAQGGFIVDELTPISYEFADQIKARFSPDSAEVRFSRQRNPQEDTPEFKAWFKQSKAVDENGNPMVMYHGTAYTDENGDALTEFRPGHADAIYLTPRPEFASGFAQSGGQGANVLPVYASTQNPFDYENPEHREALREFLEDKVGAEGKVTIEAPRVPAMRLSPADLANRISKGQWMFVESPAVQEFIRASHDGFYTNERGTKNLAVFRSEQVKSATGNDGGFDATNPDIRRSKLRQTVYRGVGDGSAAEDGAQDGNLGPGYYTTESEQAAKEFASRRENGRVLSGTLNASRILDLDVLLPKDVANLQRVIPRTAEGLLSFGWPERLLKNQITRELVNEDLERTHDSLRKGAFSPRQLARAVGDDRLDVLRAIYDKAGYDAIARTGDALTSGTKYREFVTFSPESQSLSDTRNDVRRSPRRNELGFYSALAANIDGINIKQAPAGAWKTALKGLVNKGAIKQEELFWTGLEDWLDLQQGKISKQQVSEYLDANGVKVEEVVLGENGYDAYGKLSIREGGYGDSWMVVDEEGRVIGDEHNTREEAQAALDSLSLAAPSKYKTYTLPGGENYREVLLTLPAEMPELMYKSGSDIRAKLEMLVDAGFSDDAVEEAAKFVDDAGSVADGLEKQDRWIREGDDYTPAQMEAGTILRVLSNINKKRVAEAESKQYKSAHWDQPNVLAHIRVDDRIDADGKRVLFVEEVQSDWGQEGKKRGFKQGDVFSGGQLTYDPDERDRLQPAPFVTKTEGWLNLALKRIMAMAVDGGYDRVAFVNGEQSADRYDLSRQVDSISYEPTAKGYYINVMADGRNIKNGDFTADELEDIVGKELVQKMEAREGKAEVEPGSPDYEDLKDVRVLRGDGLKVGGEGMKTFYDRIVPNATNALLKKVSGEKLGKVGILAGVDPSMDPDYGTPRFNPDKYDMDDEGRVLREQPGFNVTPKLIDSATQGFALFSRQRLGGPLELESSNVVVDGSNPYSELISNSSSGQALGEKGRDFLRFFGDLLVLEGVQPSVNQGSIESLRRNSQLLRRLYGAESGAQKGYSLLDAPAKRMVMKAVGDSINNLEVFRSVVEAIPVDVMNVLRGKKIPSERNAGDMPVLLDGLSSDADVAVSIAMDVAANVVADIATAKRAKDSSGIWDVAGKSLNGGAAVGAQAGNLGQDDGLSIVRSTGRTASGQAWEIPTETAFDNIIYKLQDKAIDTKRVVEAIKEASGAIADDLNVYLREELFHGRAAKRTEDFANMELTPLIEQLQRDGLKMEELEEYLHARHAPEANRIIAQRNPGQPGLQDGGSGMMTQDALNYMASLPADLRQKLDAAAQRVDDIIKNTRQMYVDYELESQDTINAWDNMFQHYIPLQREDKDGAPGLGQGFSIKGKEAKGRTGSTRKVVDILANIALQRERAIVRGEKNRVSQALHGLAATNPNPEFWEVDVVPTERVFNPNTGLVEDRADPLYKSRENAVIAKIKDANGKVREHAVLFNEEDERAMRMAAALKNLDAAQLEGLLGVSAKISRYFASVNTSLNPVFGIVNLARDVQAALLNLSSTPLANDRAKIARYTLSAIRGIYADMRAARKGQNPGSQWAALWDDFASTGGQTGYREMFATSADRSKAIQKALDPDAWMNSRLGKIFTINGALKVPVAQARRAAKWLFDWLSDYNETFENGVRLAAYKAGLERGLSKDQAASIAKNISVNFNRKGQVALQAGALYAFFNASIQGTARIGQTLFDMDAGKPKTLRLSAFGKKVVYGGMLLGSMQAMLLAAAGFNDDDPPEFVRERSLVLPIGGGKYITVPMPLGFHLIPAIGRVTTEFALSGFKDPHKRAVSMISMFADALNPIGNAGLSMQTLAPTALDPLVALTENKDYTGKPIARESSNKAIPGHALGRDTATSMAKFLSEAINTLSGGNEYRAGVFSPTPDQLDFLWGQVTGGVGRELSKVEQSTLAVARGEALPTYKVPLVGRFVGDAKSQASEGTAFYANTERLNELETEIKGLQKDGKFAEAAELRRSRSDSYLITMANQAERQIQRLRQQKRELIKAGAEREKIAAIEDQVTNAMARLNRAAESLREKQAN